MVSGEVKNLRDGGGERAAGDIVRPGGEDVRALDEGGLEWGVSMTSHWAAMS